MNAFSLFIFFRIYFLESIILCSEPIIITGDFNIHVDDLSDHNAIILLDMLECFGLQQHVNQPTHRLGHTLDLIISRKTENIVGNVSVFNAHVADHFAVRCGIESRKPSLTTNEVLFRKL